MNWQKLLRYYFNKTFCFVWVLHKKLFLFVTILLAFILIVLRLTTIYLESNPQIIHKYIETELHYSVSFDQLKVDVNPLYPSISMINVTIKKLQTDNKQKSLDIGGFVSFDSINIQLDIILSIIRNKVVINEVVLDGLNLIVQRLTQDQISIAGFKLNIKDKQSASTSFNNDSALLKILSQNKLIVSNCRVRFVDKMKLYPTSFFTDINISIKNEGIKHQLKLQTQLNKINTQLELRLNLIGRLDKPENISGKAYVFINKLTHRTIQNFIKDDVLKIGHYRLNHLNSNAKIWAKIKKGKLGSVQGQLAINESELIDTDSKQSINLYDLKTNFLLANKLDSETKYSSIDCHNWFIDLYDLNFSIEDERFSGQRVYLENSFDKPSETSKLQWFVNKLELEKLLPAASFFITKNNYQEVTKSISPAGNIENIIGSITIANNSLKIEDINYQLQADLKDISVNAYTAMSIPKINKLNAQIIFNKQQGSLHIESKNLDLHLNSLFRDAWQIDFLAAEVYWQKDDQDWLLGLNNITFSNPHLSANADLKLWLLENEAPFLDLTAFFTNAKVINVPYYLPSKVMSEGLVHWLDNAFDSGIATDGGVVFRGQLKHFPFTDQSGVLDISFNADDVLLEYQKGWPKLKNIDALIQFTAKGMYVESQHSEVFSAVSKNINADIEDYLNPVLKITGDIQANVKDALLYLKQSNLISQDVVAMLDAEGNINLNLDLNIPTEKGEPDTKVLVSFKDADYYPPGMERKKGLVSHIKGDIMVHNKQIDGKNISASIMNSPAHIDIKTASRLTRKNKKPNINVSLNSQLSFSQLDEFNLIPKKFSNLKNYISGSTNVVSNINIPNDEQAFSFSIKTDLKGLNSQLPLPFKKQTDEKIILKGSYSEYSSQTIKQPQINIDYADKISLVILLNNRTNDMNLSKAHLSFTKEKAHLPKKDVLKISGRVTEMPLAEWVTVLKSLKTEKLEPVRQKNILPIELALTELILPEPAYFSDENNADSPKETPEDESPTLSDMEPREFPLIYGFIEAIKLGEVNFGKLSVETSRVDEDILFDKLNLQGKLFSFKGKASWNHWYDVPEVNIEGKLTTDSIEEFNKQLQLDEIIRQGKAEAWGFVEWQGAPSDFSKKNLKGNIHIDVQKGSFIDAKPGAAGRLLGLLNLNELTRRISLDFTDVKDEGFSFDTINGDFKFLNGNIYTDNLRILAPSSNLLITGRTGMVSKDFDQKVVVIPEISATLPIAGAMVAGPAGAAIAWMGQKLVGQEINKISTFTYTVQGSWENPEIKRERSKKLTNTDIKNVFDLQEIKKIDTDKKKRDDKLNSKVENPFLDN